MSGILVNSEEYKIGMYADNILLSLSNPLVSLPVVQQTLETFGSVSLYKTNYSKSSMLSINLDSTLKPQICNLTFFSCAPTNSITYLGVQLFAPSCSIFTANYNLRKLEAPSHMSSSAWSPSFLDRTYCPDQDGSPITCTLFLPDSTSP